MDDHILVHCSYDKNYGLKTTKTNDRRLLPVPLSLISVVKLINNVARHASIQPVVDCFQGIPYACSSSSIHPIPINSCSSRSPVRIRLKRKSSYKSCS